MLVVILHGKPFEEARLHQIEVFNECTILLLTYLLLLFSDLVPTASIRSDIGLFYMSVSFGNIAVHLYLLLSVNLSSLFKCLKRRKGKGCCCGKKPRQSKAA